MTGSNLRPLVFEATALSTEPQPLPITLYTTKCDRSKNAVVHRRSHFVAL